MNARQTVTFSLGHRLDVGKISEFLVHQLEGETWYVVCHREHQLVLHISRFGSDCYAVSFDCTPPADKGIYHGSLTSHFSIVPLREEPDLPPTKVDQIKAELTQFAQAAAVHAS